MRIAAVVVSHNRRYQLRRTVRRLLEEGIDHLVVVDNASTDGSRDWLARQEEPRLHVIFNRRNAGGAGGFETGLRAARALYDPDWYLVMDDDARPHPGALDGFRRLVAPAGGGTVTAGAAPPARPQTGNGAGTTPRSRTGGGAPLPSADPPGGRAPGASASLVAPPDAPAWEALAGGVYYPDGAICETNRPSRNPFWHLASFLRTALGGGRAGFHVADRDYARLSPLRIDAASFVGLFLSRAAILRAGYPQGELFIYGDDVLYTLELTRAGGRIGFAPWLGFEHDCTTFRRGEGQIHRPLWKVYYNYRNGLFAYRAAAGPLWFWPVLLLATPKWALKARGYQPAERPTYLRLLALALADGLAGRRNRPHREIRARARKRRQRLRGVTPPRA